MQEVIGQENFDEGLFKQFVLSKLHQQVQAVLVSFHKNAEDELAAFVDWIIEITRIFNSEVYSDKEKPKSSQQHVADFLRTLPYILVFVIIVNAC